MTPVGTSGLVHGSRRLQTLFVDPKHTSVAVVTQKGTEVEHQHHIVTEVGRRGLMGQDWQSSNLQGRHLRDQWRCLGTSRIVVVAMMYEAGHSGRIEQARTCLKVALPACGRRIVRLSQVSSAGRVKYLWQVSGNSHSMSACKSPTMFAHRLTIRPCKFRP